MAYIWKRSNVTYTFWQNDAATPSTNGIHSGPGIIFAGNKPGQTSGPTYYPPGIWNNIDLKPLGVSANANSCVIAGHLIITEASPSMIDDLNVAVRPPGSTMNEGNYQMQAMAALDADGARGNQHCRVSLVNGIFQLHWRGLSNGMSAAAGPTGFLVNLWLEEWNAWEDYQAPTPEPAPDQVIKVPLAGLNIRFEQE